MVQGSAPEFGGFLLVLFLCQFCRAVGDAPQVAVFLFGIGWISCSGYLYLASLIFFPLQPIVGYHSRCSVTFLPYYILSKLTFSVMLDEVKGLSNVVS